MVATLLGGRPGRRRGQRHQHGTSTGTSTSSCTGPGNRPLVTGAVTPRNALVFAITLEVVAFVELWAWVNLLSAVLAVSATLFYVFVYTLWLKRTCSQNIVIGGAAGAVPVLVGWAAVTDSLAWTPVVLFAIIFVWTPPHFWALAVKYRDDYRGGQRARCCRWWRPSSAPPREILVYTVVLVAVSAAARRRWRHLGALYLVAAAGARRGVHRARRAAVRCGPRPKAAMQLFSYSITYLTLLFVLHGGRRLRPRIDRSGTRPATSTRRRSPRGRPRRRPPRARRPSAAGPAAAAGPAHRRGDRRRCSAVVLFVGLGTAVRARARVGRGGRPWVDRARLHPALAHRRRGRCTSTRLGRDRHRPVVLNFFASWCVPCQQETPLLATTADGRAGQGLARCSSSGSTWPTRPPNAVAFVQQAGITYPVGADATPAGGRRPLRAERGAATPSSSTASGQVVGHVIGRGRPAPSWTSWLHRLNGSRRR